MGANDTQNLRPGARRQLFAALREALDFAERGGDPRSFLRWMLSPSDGGAWVRAGDDVGTWKDLQAEVGDLLRGLATNREAQLGLTVRFDVKRVKKRVVVARGGQTRDLYLYALLRIVEQVGVDKVLACPAPKPRSDEPCGRLFLKVTRKECCSSRCQSRRLMRDVRQAERTPRAKGGKRGQTRKR